MPFSDNLFVLTIITPEMVMIFKIEIVSVTGIMDNSYENFFLIMFFLIKVQIFKILSRVFLMYFFYTFKISNKSKLVLKFSNINLNKKLSSGFYN